MVIKRLGLRARVLMGRRKRKDMRRVRYARMSMERIIVRRMSMFIRSVDGMAMIGYLVGGMWEVWSRGCFLGEGKNDGWILRKSWEELRDDTRVEEVEIL